MTIASLVMFCLVAILPVWAIISPRTQWRLLTGWSERDPGSHEPGAVAIAIHRTVAALAIMGAVIVALSFNPTAPHPVASSSESAAADPVREHWGTPDPVVVNRVFATVSEAPLGLVKVPLLRYQSVDGAHRNPTYLFSLKGYSRPNAAEGDGYIGTKPNIGMSALDSANIVVQAKTDPRCTPQQVLVVESATSVVVAVYYGLPITGASPSTVEPCVAAGAGDSATSELIPIRLAQPVGTRNVVNLNGAAIANAATQSPTAPKI